MRLIWTIIAGLERPLTNQPVFDLQAPHRTPDLLDIESGRTASTTRRTTSTAPADRGPAPGGRVQADRAGAGGDDGRRAGWRDAVAERIVRAHDRAVRHGRDRLWTIEQPSWWTRTETVAQRRALSPDDQLRLLARRSI